MVAYLIERLRSSKAEILVGADGKKAAKEQFIQDIEKACGFWNRYFQGKGHHVGLIAENSYLWLVQCMGIIASGNIVAAYNYNLPDEEIQYLADASDTELLLCDAGLSQEYSFLKPQIPVMELPDAAGGEAAEIEENGDDDTVMILFSSGTSGKSKPVPLTKRNFMAYGKQCVKEKGGETTLMPLPLYHIGGMYGYYELIKGSSLILSSAKYLLRDVGRERITRAFFVPAMVRLLLQKWEEGAIPESQMESLKNVVSLGAPLAAADEAKLEERGIALENFYGLTETTGLLSGPGGPLKKGTAGKVMPYVELKIVGGEIAARGANVMNGYYKRDQETEAVLRDGWIYTGDLGEIDEDGYLTLIGRQKNIIILANGENISPEELENGLYRCPLVTECRVYEKDGKICADIYTRPDGTDLESRKQAIEEFCRRFNRTLSPASRIAQFYISQQELEKNAVGKIKRH